jgi:hypothetical protein
MKKFFLMLLALLSIAAAEASYEIALTIYRNDTVILDSMEVVDAKIGESEDGDYQFEIIGKDGKSLYERSFDIDFTSMRLVPPNSSIPDVVERKSSFGYWYLPYFEDAAVLNLYHEDKKIFEHELPSKEINQNDSPEEKIADDSKPLIEVDQLLFGVVCISTLLILAGIYLILAKPFGNGGDGG